MNFPSIRVEGAILSSDLLDRLDDAKGQGPADFGLDPAIKVKDEIARAWADAQDYWRIFQRKSTGEDASPLTTETRNLWMTPLLGLLGYQLEYQPKGEALEGRNYAISHRAVNRGNTSVHIIGYREPAGLDRKPESRARTADHRALDGATASARMSAHGMLQEYLNLTEQLYGLVSNGRVLRLLRDSSRLVKLSYLEFDLDRIFTDGLFADFAVLYRLLHATRLPETGKTASGCWFETYHQDGIEQGTRIREGLRRAVTEALEILGTGFLAHPDNASLKAQVASGAINAEAYFNVLLRLVYRLLFLMVIEERGLVFAAGTPSRKRDLYVAHYSVQRLRRLATTRGLRIERVHDAWLALLAGFQLFESPDKAALAGTTALGGQLFSPNSLGPLPEFRLSNATFFKALDRLCNFDDPQTGQRVPVNFGALATEEFGSVYESLLELHPMIASTPTPSFGFKTAAGNERKTSGSYYTPSSLVDCLLDSALDPVLDARIRDFAGLGYKTVDEAVLALKVCDPAVGSGHFLIAAAQRIARRLAVIRAGDGEPGPELLRRTLREVIGHCMFGVDINPMSVELCKLGLWLEAVEPGKPLTFLDHHIKCGNSLLGATPAAIRAGIPDEAYEPITGDTKEAARSMKKLNQAAKAGQDAFDFSRAQPWDRLGNLPAAMATLDTLGDDTAEALAEKERQYRDIVEGADYDYARLLHDTWCAAFVWPKNSMDLGTELTTAHLRSIERNPYSVSASLKDQIRGLAGQYRFFHWHLEFPTVFNVDRAGGFDCVLGNPPWDQLQIDPREFFETAASDIASAETTAKRNRLIAQLGSLDPSLYGTWLLEVRRLEGIQSFVHGSGAFPLSSIGRLNSAPLFVESSLNLIGRLGRVGLVVPSGIATDSFSQYLFGYIVDSGALVSLYDFENRRGLFPAVHSSMKFSLLTCGSPLGPNVRTAQFAFFAYSVEDLTKPDVRFTLSREEISLLNPNTKTCSVFRTSLDAELTKAVYRRVPVLVQECDDSDSNPWGYESRLLVMSNTDSDQFRTQAELAKEGFKKTGPQMSRREQTYLPLYEAKMFQIFDHRASDVVVSERALKRQAQPREIATEDHADPLRLPEPRFWISTSDTDNAFGDYRRKWYVAITKVTSSTNARTAIAALLPRFPSTDSSFAMLLTSTDATSENSACFYGNICSFALDYIARQKLGGVNMLAFIQKQLPVLTPNVYGRMCSWFRHAPTIGAWLMPRVLELSFTAWDLEPFAQDCGWSGPPFRWDEERRSLLRCELDAAFFHLYLPPDANGDWQKAERETEEDLARLRASFPTPRDAVVYIMDTFPIVRRKDEEKHNGDYRTKRVILEIYDAMQEAIRTGQPYQTRLDPPPADPRCCHLPRGAE